jgi:P pilus assembly chaperone PapD
LKDIIFSVRPAGAVAGEGWNRVRAILGAGAALAAVTGAFATADAQTPTPLPAGASAAGAGPGIAVGAANLNLTPRRVVFDRKKRTEAVYVFNQGNATATFDVALIDRVMLPSGEILPLADAAGKGAVATAAAARVHSAKDLLIVTPSRLTLEPGKGKTIRIRATIPDGTEPIEYRSHLTVTTVPPADFGLTAEAAAAAQSNELVFRVQSVFGISIPLIVRGDALAAAASLGPIRLDHQPMSPDGSKPPVPTPVLVTEIRREGARSLYGNIEVRAGSGRNAQAIGAVRGIGIYAELDNREVRIPLSREPKAGEPLSIVFIDDEIKPGTELTRGSFSAP